jgi:DNA-binding response OmpR family regulator
VFDQATRRARVHGDALVLRRVEADLLAHLLSAPGRVFTRSQLVKLVCDSDDVLERVIDVHVSRLRVSLANVGAGSMIETVRGIGYRLLESPLTDAPST